MGIEQRNVVIKNRMGHAIWRFRQRFGIFLNEGQYCDIINQVYTNQAKFVCRFSKNYTLHKVTVGSELIPVVYSKKHKIIVTVYHNSWIKRNSKGQYYVRGFREKKIKKRRQRQFEKPNYQLKNKWSRVKRQQLGIS